MGEFLFGLGALFYLGGAGVFCWQIFRFLYDGYWPEFSALDMLMASEMLSPFLGSWLVAPTAWRGIHHMLASMNAGLFLFLCGALLYVLAVIAAIAGDEGRSKNAKKENLATSKNRFEFTWEHIRAISYALMFLDSMLENSPDSKNSSDGKAFIELINAVNLQLRNIGVASMSDVPKSYRNSVRLRFDDEQIVLLSAALKKVREMLGPEHPGWNDNSRKLAGAMDQVVSVLSKNAA